MNAYRILCRCSAFERAYCQGTQTTQDRGRQVCFVECQELLRDWARDQLDWDANDLLCKLKSWQLGDFNPQPANGGALVSALNGIKA